MKKYLQFVLFKKKFKRIYNSIPNYDRYRDLSHTTYTTKKGKTRTSINVSYSDVKRLLPLESLTVEYVYHYTSKVIVEFDWVEFEKVFFNDINEHILELGNKLINNKNIRIIYENDKDTYDILVECIESKIHHSKCGDVVELINYLKGTLPESNIKAVDLEERLSFELEFIKRQSENKGTYV